MTATTTCRAQLTVETVLDVIAPPFRQIGCLRPGRGFAKPGGRRGIEGVYGFPGGPTARDDMPGIGRFSDGLSRGRVAGGHADRFRATLGPVPELRGVREDLPNDDRAGS